MIFSNDTLLKVFFMFCPNITQLLTMLKYDNYCIIVIDFIVGFTKQYVDYFYEY